MDPYTCAHNHRLHYGSGLPVFRGDVRQDGWGLGGLIGGLIRQAVPILKPIVKSFAKTALKTGTRVLSDVVRNDVPLKDAVKGRFFETVDEVLGDDETPSIEPVRRRSKRRRRRIGTNKRRRVDILD